MASRRAQSKLSALPLRLVYIRFSSAVWIAACLALMGISLVVPGRIGDARMAISDVISPIISAASKPVSVLSERINGMTDIASLRAENLRLEQENARLREWYQTALTLQAENQSLREFLNVQSETERAIITTRVISDTGGRFVKSVLVPVGARDGVVKGQAVVTDRGMIGRIVNVGRNSARVLMVNDLNARIPVMVQDTHHRAVLSGQNTVLTLNHLGTGSGVEVGARIVTSGHEGILPANIPIGQISKIDDKGRIFVTPFADLSKLHFVQIISVAQDQQDGLFVPAARE